MIEVDRELLLERLALHLGSTDSQRQILELAAAEIRNTVGYRTTWLSVLLPGSVEYRVLAAELAGGEDLWSSAETIPIEGDRYVERILESEDPQVIVDIRSSDEVVHEIYELLDCRTMICVPILLDGELFGALGTGTFGEEGTRPPDSRDLEFLGRVGELAGAAIAKTLRSGGHI